MFVCFICFIIGIFLPGVQLNSTSFKAQFNESKSSGHAFLHSLIDRLILQRSKTPLLLCGAVAMVKEDNHGEMLILATLCLQI